MYGRMSAAVGELLAIDTFSAGYTRHLPPTPSMPGASYDPEAFMSQLQRHAGMEGPA